MPQVIQKQSIALNSEDAVFLRALLARVRHPETGFRFFFDNYVRIIAKDVDGGHHKPTPWKGQTAVIDALAEGSKRLIILKARQLGISTLIAAYAFWHAHFFSGRNVLITSKGQREARAIIEKAKYIYRNLPWYLQVQLSTENADELVWDEVSSRIVAVPSTPGSGRGEGTTLVVGDEWAYHPYAEENWASIQPTLGKDAVFIGLSTANGRGNFFHSMWEQAESGENGFQSIFLNWKMADGRDEAWRDQQVRELRMDGKDHLVRQEYPDTPAEAFIASGNCKFDVDAIYALLGQCRPPKKTEMNGALKIWRDADPTLQYIIGVDVARGLDKSGTTSDACAAAVYSAQGECVATLHGRWEPMDYARHLIELGFRYRNALLAVENNDAGSAVIVALRQARYQNLYQGRSVMSQIRSSSRSMEYGWKTTRASKTMMIATLASHLNDGLKCYDAAFYDECLNFVDLGNGGMGSTAGTHDDRVIAHAIALQLLPAMIARQQRGDMATETYAFDGKKALTPGWPFGQLRAVAGGRR